MHPTPVRFAAHAKINLALSLAAPEPPGSPRAGWHRICTWMHAIDLADEVLVEPTPGAVSTWCARWAADAPRLELIQWAPTADLAWRALRALERRLGRLLPTRIVLRKRVPTGAGLGGGSADAAAALLALNRAWGLDLGLEALSEIGATLGSDVPFFIDTAEGGPPKPAIVGGFGEVIGRRERAAGEVIVIVPPFGCPTGRVYGAFDGLVESGSGGRLDERRVEAAAAAGTLRDELLFNDLAEAACVVRPELRRLRERASAALGRPVHVTGSGSAMFALVGGEEPKRLAARVRAGLPGASVFLTALV